MRVRGAPIQTLLLGMALLVTLAWNVARASEIKDLSISSGATGTRAEIVLDGSGDYRAFRLQAPARLVVDLPDTRLAADLQMPSGSGLVQRVRTGQPVAGTTRIVFDLGQEVVPIGPQVERTAEGARLILHWPGDGSEPTSVAAATAPADPIAALAASAANAPGGSPVVADAMAPAGAATQGVDVDTDASAAATSRLISQIAARHVGTPMPPATANASPGVPAIRASGEPAAATPAPVKTLQDVMRGAGMRPLTIAIDAGHGGQDPGAIGKNGTREKDVVLDISKELARQINATPGLKAYLTRDTDVFIPLGKRAQLARQAGADMFISIHANAAENRNADGSSVFVLSLKGASSQRARWLANKENASDLVGGVRLEEAGNTLASVLLDLTQSGQMKASEEAAEQILQGLTGVGNIHKHEVERANFAVLRTSDIPAMLVETAFISNPEEERLLKSSGFQSKLARAVLDGINGYFTEQPPPGTLYAARAAARWGGGATAAGGSP